MRAPQPPEQPPPPARSYGDIPSYPGYGYPGATPTSRWPRYLTFLKRLWGIPVLTLATALAAAAVYTVMQPPSYVSSARLWVSGKLQLKENSYYSEELQYFFGTQVELLQSDKLREAAQARVQTINPGLAPCFVKLQAYQVPKSSMFILRGTGEEPEYTQTYLNALVDEYLIYRKQVRAGSSDETLASLSTQVFQHEKDLKAEQEKLTAYEKTNNMAVVQDQATAAASYLAKLNVQLSDLSLESKLIGAVAAEISTNGTGTNFLASKEVSSLDSAILSNPSDTPEIRTARQQLQMLKLQRDELTPFLRPKHPKLGKLDDQIARAQKVIALYQEQTQRELEPASQARQLRIETLQTSIKDWEAKLVEANNRLGEYNQLRSNVQRIQNLYDKLLSVLQSVDINKNLDQETVSIMERPSKAYPARTNLTKSLILACVAGIAGGLMLVFLIARFDDRLTSMNELMEQFDEEIVGQVPKIARMSRRTKLPLVEPDDKRHIFAESYRNIRSSVFFMPVEEARPKLLLVTSSVPSEGKSTVSANLARTMAFSGGKILLIDGDLRKGRQHDYFGVKRGDGLSKLLHDTKSIDDYIVPTNLPNLFLIPCGEPITDASECFLSAQFERVLSEARDNFDQVIIDSAPVFAADDAPTMAPKMDGVLFVIRGGYTRARMARQALEILYQRQSKVLGLIFNGAEIRSRSYYYYKYADYYHTNGKKS